MLKIGYMWELTEKKNIEDKLRIVANYYNRKVGKFPEFIVINDKAEYSGDKFGDIDILRKHWIMKNYFWVGVYG